MQLSILSRAMRGPASVIFAFLMMSVIGAPLHAEPIVAPATQPALSDSQPTTREALGKVVVTSDLDVARDQIAPSLGAVTYSVGPDQIQNIPGGEATSFQQVLLRAPGVVQDSFGQEHVRGEHANLTYRVNGVLLPQPIATFGQELDTRLIQSTTLVTGSLPAEFGFHTAGIVDVTTKSGSTLQGGELSLYGGMYDTIQPSFQVGGTTGKLDYFFTGSFNHNDIGIENPTGSHHPLHDYSDQEKGFAYLSYLIDDSSRLSLLANASYANFQIPNVPGAAPGFTLAGNPPASSSKLDENQAEQEYYTVLSYQKSVGNLSFQLSGFTRYGKIHFTPDVQGDLIFQGVAGQVANDFTTSGLQFDGSYILDDHHTIRAGVVVDYTAEGLNTNTFVFPVDASGAQASTTPLVIGDNSGNEAWESGIYLQDEFRITPKLTLNYGLRYDRFDSNFDTEDQVSPRANVVFKIDDKTTAHAGYSRYFVTPPVQNEQLTELNKFGGTTNAPDNFRDDPPKCERSNYYDAGISRQITTPWQVGIDGFYKQSHNLIDLGQFGAPVIFAPFNYREGTVYGAEFSTTYKDGGFSAFGNFSWVKTMAHDIDSQEFLIDSAELAYIQNHNIHLDHDNEFAISAGASYQWKFDRVYIDFLYGSGLRGGFANINQLSQHYPVNIGYEHVWPLEGRNAVKFRVDVVNVFDEKYQIRSGTGIGVGAPQYGQRLGVFGGVTYVF